MYLLEGRVEFEPGSGILTDNEKTIKLSENASRCLEILILCQGKYVSRDEFINHVWLKHGAFVSESSVRQTLHLLRKILGQFSLPKELIRNTRRQGYCIDMQYVSTASTGLTKRLLKKITNRIRCLSIFLALIFSGTLLTALFLDAF